MKNKISDDDDDERNKINQPIGISMENGFNQKKKQTTTTTEKCKVTICLTTTTTRKCCFKKMEDVYIALFNEKKTFTIFTRKKNKSIFF